MAALITTSNSVNRIFASAAHAETVAADLSAYDGTCTYEVRVDPAGSGRALIAVIDNDDGFLGYV